ncbi:MAG TPA: OmpH family outer membrane protein [Saprospiraceae bacterium]|nr:OmpH family outer membrane protein [Saprospiraceae bacterium]
MKLINWILHAISLIAIIYLFTQRNCCSVDSKTGMATSTNLESTQANTNFPVAFFYSDSLLSNLGFFKENEKALKKKQESMAAELKNKELSFQKELQGLQENAQNMTRKEMETAQERLGKMEQELMQKKEKLSIQLAEEASEFNEKLHSKVTSYLKEINASGQYKYVFSLQREGNIFLADDALDITPQMIKGLNEKYSQK